MIETISLILWRVFGKNFHFPLKSSSLSWRGSPLDAVQHNSSDWLDISVMHTTSRHNWIFYSPSNGDSLMSCFLGISFDHWVNKLVQHQHHPRLLSLASGSGLKAIIDRHSISFTAFVCHASKGPFFLLSSIADLSLFGDLPTVFIDFLPRQKANLGGFTKAERKENQNQRERFSCQGQEAASLIELMSEATWPRRWRSENSDYNRYTSPSIRKTLFLEYPE